jgi:ribosome-associated protein
MKTFKVKETHVDLCDLLKLTDLTESGAEAKHIISEGKVKVDGKVELRKRAKILPGQKVEYKGIIVEVI